MSDTELSCKNGGCLKKYTEKENTDESCTFHPGKPIFHDCKKGWTCCKVTVLDWDEFSKIPGCARGRHCAKKDSQGNQNDFYKSDAVARAERGIEKQEAEERHKDINEFNKLEEEKKLEAQRLEDMKEKKPVVTASGKFKCANAGCNKEYADSENSEEACSYHQGQPIFHDIKKFWSCCKEKVVYDWEEFMKIDKCQKGQHRPKMTSA